MHPVVAADPLFDSLARALVGRYALLRQLGRGGMATVYLATDVKLGRRVAIKALSPVARAHLGSERFQREVLLAAQLSHPHIVPLFEADEADDVLFYVMEYVEGESLKDRLAREGAIPLEEAVRIAAEVGDALQYAHDRGVVHRDVKPGNILLSQGHAVVTDFGIAKLVDAAGPAARLSLTGAGITVGTPEYMSPEQASGATRIDARADVYALAAVVYEMLAGEPPFTGPSAQAVVARVLSDRPRPIRTLRPTLPPYVDRALAAGLAKVPADRPAGTRAFVDLLTRRSGTWPHLSARHLAWALLGFTAVGAAAWWALWLRVRPPPAASVAVLEFESADSADAYIADGVTEAVTTSLGHVERLIVKSRNAVQRLRGAARTDPAALGQALGVAYLVSGGIRHSGHGLHVGSELLRAADGVHLWGAQYERGDSGLQDIEEDVARSVATTITGKLAPEEQVALAHRRTRDPEAYDHFLRGNYNLAKRTPREVRSAIAEYDSAAGLDPRFAPALARVALGYALFLDWGWEYPGLAPDSVLARGVAAANRSLEQDSSSADAWMARGFLLSFQNPRTFAGVPQAFERAVALDPRNPEAHHQFGMALLWLGEDSAAAEMYGHALRLEPERAITLFNLARVRMLQRRYPEAKRWLDSALAVDPAADYAYVLRGLAQLRLANLAEARADAGTAVRLHAGFQHPGEAVLALADLQAGDTTAARSRVERLDREVRQSRRVTVTDAAWLGGVLVALREPDRGLAWLERAPRGARLWFYLRAPEFDTIRGDPRFRRLVEASRPPGAQ
ncbi:MAG TPA: protein kinase [Gemmatimonadales bacterium]|nr:protein kinase [Gemmatimonadales bacterium]